jgi:GNAT superfamily N-acetyltransferase
LVRNQPNPRIRQVSPSDLAAVVLALGQQEFYDDRFLRQQEGRGQLLAAWSGDEVVGAVYLWQDPAEEPELLEYLPGVPLLTHLEVVGSERNRGIGTMLVDATEEAARNLGYGRIALAVEQLNVAAERLYGRLGYRQWDRGLVICTDKVIQPDGTVTLHAELCRVMVKTLSINLMHDRPRTHARYGLERVRPKPSGARGR